MKYIKQYKILFLLILIISVKVITYTSPNNEVKTQRMIVNTKSQSLKKALIISQKEEIKAEKVKMSQMVEIRDSFIKLTKQCENIFPTKKMLSTISSKELHQTPYILLEFASQIANIKKFILKNQDQHIFLKEQAALFFKNCSMDTEILDSARSLCLSNLLIINLKRRVAVDLNLYPTNILALSKDILDLH